MDYALKQELFKRLVNEPDEKNQIYCCIEEMSEATKCLTKYLRKSTKFSINDLTEELAHAFLMLDVISDIFNINQKEIEYYQLDALKRCYNIK